LGKSRHSRHNNIKGLAIFAKPFSVIKRTIPRTIPHKHNENQGKKRNFEATKNPALEELNGDKSIR
jgi:hypothetical protein